jgi:AraC family transcriptional regulator of arabinose operon
MSESSFRGFRPYGEYAGASKDNLYVLRDGHMYTTPHIVAAVNTRFFSTVDVTTDGSKFELSVGANSQRYDAIAVRPATQRFVVAQNVRFVTLGISPLHRHFRSLRAIPSPGVVALNRSAFNAVNSQLDAAFEGYLSLDDAAELHDYIFEAVARMLPRPDPIDRRIQSIVDHLEMHPEASLESLARIAGLSYKRVSLLFGQVVGLPLRSYLLWKKLHRYETLAGQYGATRSMTDMAHAAGFVDSAHLCRTFQEVFGAPPSYFFDNENVRVKTWLRNSPMTPGMHESVALSRSTIHSDPVSLQSA